MLLPELCQLRRDDDLAIGVRSAFALEIFLAAILSDMPVGEPPYHCHDRAIYN
jgi:hypothetical protein